MIKDSYDIVCLVSNDLSYDRRMIRICETLSKSGLKVLLVGRELRDSKVLRKYSFDQLRVRCSNNSGFLFYAELVLRFRSLLNKLKFKKLMLVDLDTLLVTRLIRKRHAYYILDLHEFFEEVPELERKPIKKLIWTIIERFGVPRCDLILYSQWQLGQYVYKPLW